MIELAEAATKLDHENDEHWTSRGEPRADILAELAGVEKVTRGEIREALPDLERVIKPPPPTAQDNTQESPPEPVVPLSPAAETPPPPEAQSPTQPQAEPSAPVVSEDQFVFSMEIHDKEIMSMSSGSVLADMDLCSRMIEELDRENTQISSFMDKLKQTLAVLSARSSVYSRRYQDLMKSSNRNSHAEAVKHYQASQQSSRIARFQRMQALTQGQVSPKELAKNIDFRSPIEKSAARRKARTPIVPPHLRG